MSTYKKEDKNNYPQPTNPGKAFFESQTRSLIPEFLLVKSILKWSKLDTELEILEIKQSFSGMTAENRRKLWKI